jgi:virulence factor Mce-like protein
MKRLAATAVVLVACAALVLFATGAGGGGGGGEKGTYWVQLDNAFGLVGGADVKVAGVRAGKITGMKLDRRNLKALVKIKVTKGGPLHADTFCETRPQSLIGEYFIDCQPGTSRDVLKAGATVPVTHTASTVAPDLINDIMRLPYRERLRIIIDELGTGLAGRSGDLNSAIRRAVPALRETDKVLRILGEQNKVIRDLTQNSDTVITAIARNKRDVGRWVVEARNTAEASAERRTALAQTFHNLPAFLSELRPTMAELGQTADAQTPALRNLGAAAGQLRRFLEDLGPFSNASRPAVRSLGQASQTGREAVTAAQPTVSLLRQFATSTPELGKNLAIVLEHLDNRQYAVENDPRSPGGQGYTGLEALLSYVFDQALSINIHDGNSYILKVALFADKDCLAYANGQAAKSNPKCSAALGPNQPGINQPPYNLNDDGAASRTRRHRSSSKTTDAQPQQQDTSAGGGSGGSGGGSDGGSGGGTTKPPIDVGKTLDGILGGGAPKLPPAAQIPTSPDLKVPGPSTGGDSGQKLLDYLLGP